MIEVHVAQLLKAPVGNVRTLDFEDSGHELQAELGVRGPIAGTCKLTRTSHGILVDCSYRAELEQECARCLGVARTALESSFSQEFLPTMNIVTGMPEDIPADPDEPRIGPDHIINLTEAIRQDILLQEPFQPLCRPDCAGLCSVCGANLNDTTCGHDVGDDAEPPSRLGELLRRQLQQSSS